MLHAFRDQKKLNFS